MITDARLRRQARAQGIRLGYAEKNYVNSWILWSIYTNAYGENLLFKGGTALSKIYFPETWRYSEDLDFGVVGTFEGAKADLASALADASTRSGIEFEVTKHHELRQAGYPTHYVDVDVQYSAILGHRNTTSLDVMIDEHLAFEPTTRDHQFADTPAFTVRAYRLEEIFAEKLRALYQRSAPRDFYDCYRIITETEIDDDVVSAFYAKCDHDGLEVDLASGLPSETLAEIRDGWQRTLPDLVAELPPFDVAYETIESYLTAAHSDA